MFDAALFSSSTPRNTVFALAIGLALSVAAGDASAACDSGLFVKSVTKTYRDAARGNRSVGATVHYPVATSTSSTIAPGCAFPVVSFGHGFTISNSAYGYLPKALVPSGYVVVMPSTEGGIPNHANFGADLAFVLKAVRADATFAAALGPKSAIGGHSMGGGAAFLGAASVPGLNALFALAPAETNPKASVAATQITAPTMVITGTRDCVTPYAQHAGLILAALATPDAATYDLPLTGANHCQFTTGSFTCSTGQATCGGSATINVTTQQTLTMNALKPFLDMTLKGR